MGATAKQIQEVKLAIDRFTPQRYLPVHMDFSGGSDPYELAEEVVYHNGIVRVTLEKGFKWDGASIPTWLPIVPWLVTLIAIYLTQSPWLWIVTALLVLYTIRLLPYMQKMGPHARAMCVHDKLYRAQSVTRIIADAIMESILESDNVPADVTWIIHGRVRRFGWIAWRKNKRAINAKTVAAAAVEINPDSELMQ